MRKINSQKEAERILSPYYQKLTDSIKTGFKDYLDMVDYDCNTKNRYLALNGRTKATLIHNLITNRIEESFKNVPDTSAKEFNKIFALYFKNKFFIRFKKFDEHLTPKVSRTEQSLRYERQFGTIPGFPRRGTFLYAGYTFNSSMTAVKSVYITCRIEGKTEWRIDLTRELSGEKDNQVFLFGKTKTSRKRIAVKDTKKSVKKAS